MGLCRSVFNGPLSGDIKCLIWAVLLLTHGTCLVSPTMCRSGARAMKLVVSVSIPFEWLLQSVEWRSKNSCFITLKGSGDFRSSRCRSLARDTHIFNKQYVTIMLVHENMPPGLSSSSPNQRRHPFVHHNENLRQSFDNQSLSECVHSSLVLDFMKSVHLNLPVPLWSHIRPKGLCWEDSLMVSDALLEILAHWRHAPQKHNSEPLISQWINSHWILFLRWSEMRWMPSVRYSSHLRVKFRRRVCWT